jgi:hypothetical protein
VGPVHRRRCAGPGAQSPCPFTGNINSLDILLRAAGGNYGGYGVYGYYGTFKGIYGSYYGDLFVDYETLLSDQLISAELPYDGVDVRPGAEVKHPMGDGHRHGGRRLQEDMPMPDGSMPMPDGEMPPLIVPNPKDSELYPAGADVEDLTLLDLPFLESDYDLDYVGFGVTGGGYYGYGGYYGLYTGFAYGSYYGGSPVYGEPRSCPLGLRVLADRLQGGALPAVTRSWPWAQCRSRRGTWRRSCACPCPMAASVHRWLLRWLRRRARALRV